MSVTGSLSNSAKYRRVPGQCMETITYLLFCDVRASSDPAAETQQTIPGNQVLGGTVPKRHDEQWRL
jgi:hypothetical protein